MDTVYPTTLITEQPVIVGAVVRLLHSAVDPDEEDASLRSKSGLSQHLWNAYGPRVMDHYASLKDAS